MTPTASRTEDRVRPAHPHTARPAAGAPSGRRARRGGLLAAAALAATCSVTTVLLAAGVAAGAGLAGSLELTVVAAAVPVTLLAWHVRRRVHGRSRDETRNDQP